MQPNFFFFFVPLILLSTPHMSLLHKAQTTNIQMVPIFPNNNLSVSSVIVVACMQGRLHKKGLCVYWGGGFFFYAFDTFILFLFPFAHVGCHKCWRKTLGYVEGTR